MAQLPIFATSCPMQVSLQIYDPKTRVGMRGMLKTKSAGKQILLVVSITLACFFLLGLLGTVILSMVTGMNLSEIGNTDQWNYSDPRTVAMIRGMQAVQFVSLFLVPAWINTYFLTTDRRTYLGLRVMQPKYLLAGVAVMIISIPFVNWMGELNRQIDFPPDMAAWMKEKEEQASLMIRALLSRRSPADLMLNLFFIADLASVGEELLFRGLLQRLFIKLFRSPLAGILVSAFLFSAMHMQFYGFFPRFLLGAVLGLIYWYSGSLWIAIIAHFVYDAALIILAYFYPEMLNDESTVKVTNMAFAGLVSFAITAALIFWMKVNSRTKYAEVYANDAVPVKDHPF
jgi:membrane protease YdiL (CAAX protease family)